MNFIIQSILYTLISSILLVSVDSHEFFVEKFIPLKISVDGFSINENKKFIFLISQERNELIKIDLDGVVKRNVGGFGWNNGQFDFPSSIVSTALDIYVSDYNNHRIQRFDSNLNFISSLERSDQINFEFPISISLSTKGDLYILDSRNKRILKINEFNRLERIFGNYETGKTLFSNPTLIKVDNEQKVYVLDRKNIFIFDQFGIYLKTITLPENFKENLVDFYPDQNKFILLTSKNLYKLNNNEIVKINLTEYQNLELSFKRIEFKLGRYFILTSEGILICKEKN